MFGEQRSAVTAAMLANCQHYFHMTNVVSALFLVRNGERPEVQLFFSLTPYTLFVSRLTFSDIRTGLL
jgi:hypothetical protein